MQSRWQQGIAEWISLPVPASTRILRSLDSDHVSWREPGESMAQEFVALGNFTAVSIDLVYDHATAASARIELLDRRGAVIAARTANGHEFRWERFQRFVGLERPAVPGKYQLRVTVLAGKVGWSTASVAPAPAIDDGVSPIQVEGRALRNGVPEPGVRTIGVDTIPAPNPVFRRRFTLESAAKEASLTAVGLGYGTFRINGQPVSDAVLEPSTTDFDKTVLVRRYNVTHLLQEGLNEIYVELGRGFFSARGASIWGWHLAPWHREPMLLAQLDVQQVDGERIIIASDATWEAAAGPVVQDFLYTGIVFDAGKLSSLSWCPASPVAGPSGVARFAAHPPIRPANPLDPATTKPAGPKSTVLDFGSILTGRIGMGVTAASAGAELVIRYGEKLDEAGNVVCENDLIVGGAQTDRYISAGNESGTLWEPDFGYKGFRYVEVTTSGAIEASGIVATPLHTAVRRAGEFICSEPTLTWLEGATQKTFLNNLQGVPTDTPVYEKNGWTADAHLVCESVLHQLDLRTILEKWLDDHLDAQGEDGTIPQIVPTPGWGNSIDPAWSCSLILIAWNLYWEYGDQAILNRYFRAMKAYADHVLELTQESDGIWRHPSWGDWLSPGHHFAPEGSAPAATMMVKHLSDRMAQISDVLGMDDDRERYLLAAQRIADAYHREYFDSRSGRYVHHACGYRQTMNVLPLAFGAVPAGERERVAQSLVEDIESRTDRHLDCGAIGIKYLLPTLSDVGRTDLAISVATQRTPPGWGAWYAAGSATLWESWDPDSRSHDHYFLGSASAWVQQRIGGIRSTAPGWRTFEFAPPTDPRIESASITHRVPSGEISASWVATGERTKLSITVPPGSTCTVRLPSDSVIVTEGEHRFHVSNGVLTT